MSDIVARLHAMIDANYGDVAADSVYGSAMSDAADEIERLRAAMRPFAARTNSEDYIKTGPDNGLCAAMSYEVGHYREARAAIAAGLAAWPEAWIAPSLDNGRDCLALPIQQEKPSHE